MENNDRYQKSSSSESAVIQVVEEQATVHKEIIETGKVRIRKTVSEETVSVNLPILNESYHVERVPVASRVLDEPPASIRHEGDKTIIPVIREITVVQTKYEVIEEIHLTRRITETPLTQEITLRKEHVDIESTNRGT